MPVGESYVSENFTSDIASNPNRSVHRAAARTDTRSALVWCGTELLTERGFQITGIDEVLKRVGVPKGSFYHYFKSKDHFGHAVIDNYEAYYAKKMDRIFDDAAQSPLQRLVNFTVNAKNGMVKFDFKRGCLIGNLGQELAALDTQFRERLEGVLVSWEKRVAECLSEAIDVGELAPGQGAQLIAALGTLAKISEVDELADRITQLENKRANT